MFEIINFRIIFKLISRNLYIISFALLSCVGISIMYSENIMPFIISFGITFILGLCMNLLTMRHTKQMTVKRKDAYLIVTLSWLFLSLVGCLPYIISGAIPSFINAFFESVSGFTTTGSSILTDIESLPKSILFWRSLTHWIGGIGIIILVIIIMPTLQIGGYHLFTLESSLQEKIQPKIKSVGLRLLLIYVLLTLIEIIFLMLGKMSFFESTCHAFGTVSTGGFSPKNTSVADYSPYIQYVIMIFMLLSGTNFVIHYYLFKRRINKIKANEEYRFYLWVIVFIGGILTAVLFFDMHKSLEEAFREAFFQLISIITCTGFASADYLLWPDHAWIIVFFAMFLGGSTGSTSGGIKMARHLLVLKNIGRILRQQASPSAIIPLRLNKKNVSGETNSSIMTFVTVYFMVFAFGSFILATMGIDARTATSSVATCMAGIGPGIGEIGPTNNFAHLPALGKLTLSFIMIIGRLEIYTVLVLFTRSFWRK